MPNELCPLRGEWMAPLPRVVDLPPRKRRYPPPLRTCRHCGLKAETLSKRCPVCDARYPRRQRS